MEQTRSSGWWDWSCGVISPAERGWSSEQISSNFPWRAGRGRQRVPGQGRSSPSPGWESCRAWGSPGWWGWDGPSRGVPGLCAPSHCSLKPGSGQDRSRPRCVSGGRSLWLSRSLCLRWPLCPAPTRRESDRKQKLPGTARGEARQNHCAILEPG